MGAEPIQNIFDLFFPNNNQTEFKERWNKFLDNLKKNLPNKKIAQFGRDFSEFFGFANLSSNYYTRLKSEKEGKYSTKATADEKIAEYNGYLRQIKSDDRSISEAGLQGLATFINNLHGANEELVEFIKNKCKAAENSAGENEDPVYEELSSEEYMETQRDSIRNLLDTNGIREYIDTFRAAGNTTGELSNEQRVMIAGIRETNAEFANFLEQNPAATMGAYARSQAVATVKTLALEAATTALNTAISFGLSFAIQAIVTGITALVHKYDDIREANIEVANTFKNTTESIEEQKRKVQELYDTINNDHSTDSEIYDAKTELLDIQREIVDTYGDEANGVDLVNGKLDEQLKKLDEIRRKEAKAAYDKTYGSYENSKKKLEKKHSPVAAWSDYLIPYLFADKIKNDELLKQIEDLGFSKTLSGHLGLFGVTTTEAIEKYQELMTLLSDTDEISQEDITNLKKIISEKINNLDSDEYQSWLTDVENTSWEAINKDAELYGKYTEIEEAIKDFDNALASGDATGAEQQLDIIEQLRNDVENMDVDDEYIRKHFLDTIEKVQGDLNKHKLKIDLETNTTYHPVLGKSENGARGNLPVNYFKKVFDGYSDIDVKAIGLSGGTDEEAEAYGKLTEMAELYSVTVEDIIDVLVEQGAIFSKTTDAAKYTAENYTSMLSSVESLTETLDKFDSAQSKVIAGSSLTADEVNELISLYPDLISSVERTASGYTISAESLQEARNSLFASEKANLENDIKQSRTDLKSIRKELAENQTKIEELGNLGVRTPEQNRELTNARDIVAERTEDEKEITTQLEQQQFLLEQLTDPVENWADALSNVSSRIQSISDKILEMRNQMTKTGAIDPTTALDFIQSTPNWQDYITVDNGKATLKTSDTDSMLEYIKMSSGYNDTTEEMRKGINADIEERNRQQKTIDEVNNKLKVNGSITADDAKALGIASIKVKELNNKISGANETLSESEELLISILNLFKGNEAVNAFDSDVDELDHKLAMGWINDDEYLNEYNTIVGEHNAKLEESKEIGSTEASDKLLEIEEKQHDLLMSQAEKHYNDEKTQLDNQLEDRLISYLNYQKLLSALNNKYYSSGTILGSTEDGAKQYKENLREISELSKAAYDDLISRLDSAVDYGTIIDPSLLDDISQAFEGSDIPEAVKAALRKGIESGTLTKADTLPIVDSLREALLTGYDNTEALQDYKSRVTEAFEYELNILQQKLDDGLILSNEYISGYTALWEKYYKDKAEFAEEDIQTQRDILEAQKSQIQTQIDALNAISDKQTAPYQSEIDALNEVKDKYSEVMDEKIDALQEQKDALDKINEQQERENELIEKKRALEKASVKNRIVLTNNGWEARRDEEAYNEAKKEYDDAKKGEQTQLIENQIEALQEEKESREKAIDKEITAREEAIKRLEAPINNLATLLSALIAEQYNLDPEFIAKLLTTQSGEDATAMLNKQISAKQGFTQKYGVQLTGNESFNSTEALKMISTLAETYNKSEEEIAKSLGLNLKSIKEVAITASNDGNNNNDNTNKTEALLSEYKKLVEQRKAQGQYYGTPEHQGNVDYNDRPININDDGSYNTIYGTTLTYGDLAYAFEEAMVKSGASEEDERWYLYDALKKYFGNNPEAAFNVTPLHPDGTSVANMSDENPYIFDELTSYIVEQMMKGIALEDLDIFMGGNYLNGEEADADAQRLHNEQSNSYTREYELLMALSELGYNINEFEKVVYNGFTSKESNVDNSNKTTSVTGGNKTSNTNKSQTQQANATNAELSTNTTSTDKNTDALNSLTSALTGDSAVTQETQSEVITAGGFNLVADEEGKLTKKPVIVSGKQIEGQKINAVTKSEWEERHKNIIPIGDAASASIQNSGLLEFIQAAKNWAPNAGQGILDIQKTAPNIKATETEQPASAAGSPLFNCTINIEGNADEKTVQAFKTELHNELCEYTDQLYNSLHNSFIRQKNKK